MPQIIKIEVPVVFGSAWQEESTLTIIGITMAAIKKSIESHHKKNKVGVIKIVVEELKQKALSVN